LSTLTASAGRAGTVPPGAGVPVRGQVTGGALVVVDEVATVFLAGAADGVDEHPARVTTPTAPRAARAPVRRRRGVRVRAEGADGCWLRAWFERSFV